MCTDPKCQQDVNAALDEGRVVAHVEQALELLVAALALGVKPALRASLARALRELADRYAPVVVEGAAPDPPIDWRAIARTRRGEA